MTSIFVLDTNVLLSAGKQALYSFEENDVVIPFVVIKELESKKSDPNLGLPARSVIRALDKLREEGDIKTGVSLGTGYGKVRVEVNHTQDTPEALLNYRSNDTTIITVAYALQAETPERDVVLVTKDLALKIFASLVGVKVADFVPKNITGDFIDKTEVFQVSSEEIARLYSSEDKTVRLDLDVPRNAGVLLQAVDNPDIKALVIARHEHRFEAVKSHKLSATISPSGAEQSLAVDYLMDQNVKVVSLGGRAGTGKTSLALAAALTQTQSVYKKIIVFRSMHAVGGEEMGFLPGTEAEKMDPWTRAVYSALEGMGYDKRQCADLKAKGIIEVRPLTHIRGETFTNTFMIVDEAQNLERATIMSALTRLGNNSKAALSWDVSQRDNFRVGRYDGIYESVSRMMGQKLFAHVSLQRSMRSDVSEMVSRVLDDFEM